MFFGRTRASRFDDPDGVFGVMYVGLDPAAAFIEVFGEEIIGSAGALTAPSLTARTISVMTTTRPARVIDLTGERLPFLGADARIFASSHRVAQQWSRAFHRHPEQPDGLLYRARHDPSQLALALYDRDGWTFESTPVSDEMLLRLVQRYGVAVL